MKKYVILAIAGSLFAFSCQQKPAEQPAQQQPAQEQPQAEQKPAQEQAQPQAEQKPEEQKPEEAPKQESQAPAKDMQAFAQQKGCFACHDINNKKVGPAFKEVAKKFAGQADAVDELAKRTKNGGVGTWGNVPMPPQNVTEEEAKELAKWILSLK